MADQKRWNLEDLELLNNRLESGDLTPSAIAKKYGTKDVVASKANELLEFMNKSVPNAKIDPKAFEKWAAIKNNLEKRFVTGEKYAPRIANPSTAMEQLSTGNSLKVAAKDDAAKILEQKASAINPLEYKLQQNRGIATPNIMDVQQVDIVGAKKQALENLLLNPKVASAELGAAKTIGKGIGSMGKAMHGGGKIAAIGAALGAAGSAMAGENPDWNTMGKGAAEALIPAYADAAIGTLTNSESLTSEDYKKLREEKATPGALEFGGKLQEMQQKSEDEPNKTQKYQKLRQLMSNKIS